MTGWEYHEPTNLQLAFFISIYSLQHPQLRYLNVTPLRIERMINRDPVFRKIALRIHYKFSEEMGREIEKMMHGELQCSYIYPNGEQCLYFNEPRSYRCSMHLEEYETPN